MREAQENIPPGWTVNASARGPLAVAFAVITLWEATRLYDA